MLNEDVGILTREGHAAPTGIATLPGLLLNSGAQYRKPDAFKFKRNGHWIDVSTDEFLLRVEELFFALKALGVKTGDRVAIVSENRLEWAIADYAALSAGAIMVPVYPTLSPPQIEALLRHSEPTVVFVSSFDLLQRVSAARSSLGIRYVVAFDPGLFRSGVMHLDALYNIGRQRTYDYPGEFRCSALSVNPSQVATIIYTSGTTGIPKGAMLTHQNLVSNIIASAERVPLAPTDLSLSFLPLSHIFQRHVDYASLSAGATIAYAESVLTVAEDMLAVRPTFAAGVPRFFEKMYGRIQSEVSRASLVKRAVFEKAVRIGREHLQGWRQSFSCRAADSLVFRHIRERLGGRMKFFIAGGAALEKEIAEFFWAVGLPIYEGYGLSETSPVITLNGPGMTRIGSVGRVIGDQEIRVAQDGEILVRGSNVMESYFRMERETAEALAEGWFHTGDVGTLDAEGFLHITDRKKDLIITSSGKNIAPQPIESRLKLIPYFENVVVIGDQKNFVSALVVPNYDALSAYARKRGIAFERPAELVHMREIYDLAMREITRRTQDLSDFEKIRKIAFIEQPFSIVGGELTPTLKVRRSLVQKKYESTIDALYAA